MEYTYIHNHQSQFLEWFGNPFLSPKNGESVSITDVADIVLGTTPNSKIKEYWDGELKWITPAEIEEESFIISDTVRHITEDGRNSANLTLLPVGSVLFSTRAPIGKVAIAGEEMYCNQGFKNFICKPELNNVFLYYTLRLNKEYLVSLGTGTTFKELSKKIVESIKISVPAKEQQEQFERVFRQSDKSKFDGFKSQFLEWFGDFDKSEWPNMTFTEFAKIDAQMTSDFDSYSEYPHIGIESIQQNTGHILNYKTVKEDAVQSGKYVFTSKHIIYSKIRPNLNKVATPDFDGLCSADAYPILPKFKVVRKEFLAFILRSSIFLDYIIPFSRRTGMPKVNREQVEGFQLHMPPLPLQDEFLTISNQADKSKFELKRAIEAIDKVIKSLING